MRKCPACDAGRPLYPNLPTFYGSTTEHHHHCRAPLMPQIQRSMDLRFQRFKTDLAEFKGENAERLAEYVEMLRQAFVCVCDALETETTALKESQQSMYIKVEEMVNERVTQEVSAIKQALMSHQSKQLDAFTNDMMLPGGQQSALVGFPSRGPRPVQYPSAGGGGSFLSTSAFNMENDDAYYRLKGTVRRHLEDERRVREEEDLALKRQIQQLQLQIDSLQIDVECNSKKSGAETLQSIRAAAGQGSGGALGSILQAEDITVIRRMITDHERLVESKIQSEIQPVVDHFKRLHGSHQKVLDSALTDTAAKLQNSIDTLSRRTDSMMSETRTRISNLSTSVRGSLQHICNHLHISCPTI